MHSQRESKYMQKTKVGKGYVSAGTGSEQRWALGISV